MLPLWELADLSTDRVASPAMVSSSGQVAIGLY